MVCFVPLVWRARFLICRCLLPPAPGAVTPAGFHYRRRNLNVAHGADAGRATPPDAPAWLPSTAFICVLLPSLLLYSSVATFLRAFCGFTLRVPAARHSHLLSSFVLTTFSLPAFVPRTLPSFCTTFPILPAFFFCCHIYLCLCFITVCTIPWWKTEGLQPRSTPAGSLSCIRVLLDIHLLSSYLLCITTIILPLLFPAAPGRHSLYMLFSPTGKKNGACCGMDGAMTDVAFAAPPATTQHLHTPHPCTIRISFGAACGALRLRAQRCWRPPLPAPPGAFPSTALTRRAPHAANIAPSRCWRWRYHRPSSSRRGAVGRGAAYYCAAQVAGGIL